MATRIDIDGLRTWTETRGIGDRTVVLLHGGLGNSDDLLGSIGPGLGQRFRVVAFDRRGHGYTADTDEPFHYDDMATHAIAVLERPRLVAEIITDFLLGPEPPETFLPIGRARTSE